MISDDDVPMFDLDPRPVGVRLKTQGQTLALEAVPDWTHRARIGLAVLAATGEEFTAEDLTRLVGLPRPDGGTNRNNAVGAAFSAAARRREIRRVGYRTASIARSHARVLAVWIGAS